MFSLALIVSFIFLSVLVSGPVSILLEKLNMPIMAAVMASFSVLAGLYWLCVAPFPISVIGLFSAACGSVTLSRS